MVFGSVEYAGVGERDSVFGDAFGRGAVCRGGDSEGGRLDYDCERADDVQHMGVSLRPADRAAVCEGLPVWRRCFGVGVCVGKLVRVWEYAGFGDCSQWIWGDTGRVWLFAGRVWNFAGDGFSDDSDYSAAARVIDCGLRG